MTEEEIIAFVKTQNIENFNALIKIGDREVYLLDYIEELGKIRKEKWGENQSIFKYTCWDNELNQFVQHTYGYNYKLKKICEVMREYETYPTICRNLYYNRFYGNGLKVLFEDKYINYCHLLVDDNWDTIESCLDNENGYFNSFIQFSSSEQIISQDERLKYFSWEVNKCDLIRYIRMYRKSPIVEVYARCGCWRLVNNQKAIDFLETNRAYRKFIINNSKIYDLSYVAFPTLKNSFKASQDPIDYKNSLNYRIECGVKLSKEGKEVYEELIKHTSRERVFEYLENNKIAVSHYMDYIKACNWLHLNLGDTKVLFPKDFTTYHDLYVMQYADYKASLEEEEYKGISEQMKTTAEANKIFLYKGDKFEIKIAESKKDLIKESEILEHCVGRLDYDRRQADGKSMICFLRNIDNPTIPFVTIELSLKDYRVKQCYGKNNRKPSQEVLDFVDLWIKDCKKLLNKEENVLCNI